MTAQQLANEITKLENNGINLSNVYITVGNGGDLIFNGEAHDVDEVYYIDPIQDIRQYLVITYDDTYVNLGEVGKAINDR